MPNEPTTTPPATTTTTPPPATPPPSTTPATTTTTPPPTTTPPESATLLADGTPPSTPTTAPGQDATPATDEQVASFVEAIPAIDLGAGPDGNPIPLDSAAIKAVAPAMLKHGLKPEQAKDIIAAYGEHMKAQVAEQVKQERDFAEGLAAATKAELGADLPTFVADAKKGGAALFGNELWAQFVAVPALANDVRFIKALAAYGRSIKTDDGAGAAGGGGLQPKDFADAWIASSNRK